MTSLRSRSSFDWVILICAILLSAIGTAIIGSVASELVTAQVVFYLVGLGLLLALSRLDYRVFGSLAPWSFVLSLILLGITLFLGLETRGSVRWISIGSFRLQFSELLKPILVTVMASYLTVKPETFSRFFRLLFLIGLPTFLVFKQPDLGSSIVYATGFLAMIFMSGISLRYLFFSFFGAVVSLPILWRFLASYQRDRLLGFLNPGLDPLGANYNAIQAVIAVGSGLLFGRGLGRGTQTHLLFLPEHHTDFIFASVAEELGFVGAFLVLAIYFVLIWRIFHHVFAATDKTATLIGVGIGTILLVQVFINVGMNLGLFPVTGITLPLISYGGSSVLSTMISLGIIENIACLSKQDESYKIGR